MKLRLLFIIVFSLFIITCSNEDVDALISSDIETKSYYGTYLYQDNDCSGSDIQYATINEEGIAFFDFLGDNCDDTVECYQTATYEFLEVSNDTLHLILSDESDVNEGIIFLDSDSTIIISYSRGSRPEEYNWNKIRESIYSFDPVCDQDYQNTKDIADMLVYAVNDEGNLLWKNYLHSGIWDLGSTITPTQDGGFIVLGEYNAIEWGGCCYSYDSDTRDIIKLDNKGDIIWQKEITYSDNGILDWYVSMSQSLFETPNGDLVFIAPTRAGIGLNIVMMNPEGELVWSQEMSDLYVWSHNADITINLNGDLVLVSGPTPTKLTFLDYATGSIILQKEFSGLGYPRTLMSIGLDLIITGQTEDIEGLDYNPIYLLKTDSQGNEIWRKIWDQESERMFGVLDVLETEDKGFMVFCQTDPPPYATIIKTDSEGNEEWRRKYDDYVGGGQGWLHQTSDGGFFMATGYAVTKLNPLGYVEWNAACSSCFDKVFNNGQVSGINHDMKPISGGAVMVGYGSEDWE